MSISAFLHVHLKFGAKASNEIFTKKLNQVCLIKIRHDEDKWNII